MLLDIFHLPTGEWVFILRFNKSIGIRWNTPRSSDQWTLVRFLAQKSRNPNFLLQKSTEFILHCVDRSPFGPILEARGIKLTLQWPKITCFTRGWKSPIIGQFHLWADLAHFKLTWDNYQNIAPVKVNENWTKIFWIIERRSMYYERRTGRPTTLPFSH